MEQWAKEWLKEQRDQGVKCLEVKVQGKGHYVYHSTTYWDKKLKKLHTSYAETNQQLHNFVVQNHTLRVRN
jgi:hypothetical protein